MPVSAYRSTMSGVNSTSRSRGRYSSSAQSQKRVTVVMRSMADQGDTGRESVTQARTKGAICVQVAAVTFFGA